MVKISHNPDYVMKVFTVGEGNIFCGKPETVTNHITPQRVQPQSNNHILLHNKYYVYMCENDKKILLKFKIHLLSNARELCQPVIEADLQFINYLF
jgi:hypothetical protein